MKRFFTLLLGVGVALALPSVTAAQNSVVKADSVLLSERTEGNERISAYRVHTPEEADYAIHYAISSAALSGTFNGNEAEMDDLKKLMQEFVGDTTHRVTRVWIKGWASPDGPAALNKKLSAGRAASTKSYLDQHYHLSKSYPVVTESATADWAMVRSLVASDSAVPKQAAVLEILDGKHSPAATEAALKQHPEAWRYLATKILPLLRKTQVEIDYAVASVVEHTTRIEPPKPNPAPQPAPEVIVVEEVVEEVVDPCREEWCNSPQRGIIVDMTEVEVDY